VTMFRAERHAARHGARVAAPTAPTAPTAPLVDGWTTTVQAIGALDDGDDDSGRTASESPDDLGDEADEEPLDYTDLLVAAKARPKSLRRLPALMKESIRFAWHADRRLFLETTVLQFIGGAITFLQLHFTKKVLDAMTAVGAHKASVSSAMPSVAGLVLVTSFLTVSAAVLTQRQRLLSELVTRSTWQRILDVASAVNLRAFESSNFFDRFSRVQANALTRPYALTQGLIGTIGGLAGAIGVAVAILQIQPLLLPLLLVSGIPLWLTGRLQSKREFRFAIGQTPLLRLRNYLLQVLSERGPAKELRAFGFGPAIRQRFDSAYEHYIAALRRHVRYRSIVAFAGSLVSALILGLAIGALVWMVSRGQISLTGSLTAIVGIRLMGTMITAIFSSIQQIFESGLFLDDYHDFLSIKTGADTAEAGAPAPTTFTRVDVKNLSFTYPGSRQPVLRDISMHVGAGEVVALVGENGSGKTTLAKMLAVLYEPDEGTIAWDGVDIATFDRAGLRRAIAIIFQDFVRYELTARENISAGRGGAEDPAGIAAAARQAGADRYIERLPMGYETILSKQFKGGRDLSLGQWQRVALARAFYRDAPFVILDEPSSALDPRAEHELFAHIRTLLAGRTVLFISHRFSTVRSADRIYVMGDGRIVEEGSHDELMAQGGTYAELFTLQAAAYLEPKTGS
jgi:ATP-binding cassette, subfamily B, bacterial